MTELSAEKDPACECAAYTIRTDYGTGFEYDVDTSSCPIHALNEDGEIVRQSAEKHVQPVEARWRNDEGISDLSVAIDEIYFLRAMLADEAGIIEAHLDYKTFPKTRRRFAEEQIERMKRAAAGEMYAAAREKFSSNRAIERAGITSGLTNHQWAAQRGLLPATGESDA